MSLRGKRVIKVTSLVLAFTVVQVCVHANLVPAIIKDRWAGMAQGAADLTGRLTTRGNNPITVNGNSARSGETIPSGALIQTPAGIGATVQLGTLGRVDIAPGTILMINYTADRIDVNVTSGCVILTPGRGKNGSVTTPQGRTETTAPNNSPIDICIGSEPGAVPVIGQGAAANAGAGAGAGGGGLGTTGTVGLIAAAVGATAVVILLPCRRGPNPSPGTPRGVNDECRD